MDVQLSYEGYHFLIGTPLDRRPTAFNHLVPEASEIHPEFAQDGKMYFFTNAKEAHAAIAALKARRLIGDEQAWVYEVIVRKYAAFPADFLETDR